MINIINKQNFSPAIKQKFEEKIRHIENLANCRCVDLFSGLGGYVLETMEDTGQGRTGNINQYIYVVIDGEFGEKVSEEAFIKILNISYLLTIYFNYRKIDNYSLWVKTINRLLTTTFSELKRFGKLSLSYPDFVGLVWGVTTTLIRFYKSLVRALLISTHINQCSPTFRESFDRFKQLYQEYQFPTTFAELKHTIPEESFSSDDDTGKAEEVDKETAMKLEAMKLVFKTYFCDTAFLPKLKECIDKYVHKKADLKKVYLALKQLDFFKDVNQDKWEAFAEMLLVCNLYDKEILCIDDKDNQIKKLADSIRLGRKGPCEALILSINQIRDKNAWSNCTH